MSLTLQTDYASANLTPLHVMRLDRAVSRLAAQHGYTGDPLADPVPQPQTLGDLFAAGDLFLELPADLRNCDRELALRLCQAAVFGTSPRIQDLPPASAANAISADQKIGQECARPLRKSTAVRFSPVDRANRHALAHRSKERRRRATA